MVTPNLYQQSGEFLTYLETWQKNLGSLSKSEAFSKPDKTAIISVDVIKGFCSTGPLASPRVNAIIQPIVVLFETAWQHGLRNILLAQDTHEAEAVEFGSYPPHCVRGTEEAETVDEFTQLPFFDQLIVFEKNSIASGLNSNLQEWIGKHPEIERYIVVGDCTDLCTYQLAMHLRLDANERQIQRRVILPADCVNTYDISVAQAREIGGLPHPGDLMHAIFLYHMYTNGIEVFRTIQ
jgi:nicotinamidase-related amidase